MKARNIILLFLLCFTFLPVSTAFAALEDEYTPISLHVEMLPWQQVNKLLPNGSKFTVIDVETGLHFQVQRRAGSRHADVQPLTKTDTKVMKKIYDGKWSWKRRAIIVLSQDQMIAASMHGMPHGAGALPNGFLGHFCIHFAGSTTHKSGRADLSHEMMMLKAANKLKLYLQTATPKEVVDVFVVALNQQDKKILRMVVTNPEIPNDMYTAMKQIEAIQITHSTSPSQKNANELLYIEEHVKAILYVKERGKVHTTLHFILRRNTVTDRWRIDTKAFLDTAREWK